MSVKIDQIIRTKRKTISLVVSAEGEVIVRAPLKTPQSYIQDWVSTKSDWIQTSQEKIIARNKMHPPKTCREGEQLPYLGHNRLLQISEHEKEIKVDNDLLLLPNNLRDAKAAVIAWYKVQARVVIAERLEDFARFIGVEYKSLRITSAAKRWGSCSSKGSLNFSWRLVMCPLSVIDYVVVHELCHLKHHNHSPVFWQTVQDIMPDYQMQRKWLADNQRLMDIL